VGFCFNIYFSTINLQNRVVVAYIPCSNAFKTLEI